MPVKIRVSEMQRTDLRKIVAALGADIDLLVERLVPDNRSILHPEQLAAAAGEVLEAEAADALIRQALSLQTLARQISADESSVFAALDRALKERPLAEVSDAETEQLINLLRRIVDLPAIRQATRAIELAYDFANLLQSTRILTDIRPLFSKDATAIEGTVIAHTLRVRYDSGNQENELSLALDEKDLRRLMEQCKRSLEKSKTVRRQICEKLDLPTINSEADTNA